jgi:hypothetical protein
MPEFVVLAEVRSPETVKRALEQLGALTGAPQAAIVSTQHAGVEMWVAKEFAWSFLDGFLLVGETASVRRAIDAHTTRTSLATSPSYVAWGAIPSNTIAATFVGPSVFTKIATLAAKEAGQDFKLDLGNSFSNGILVTTQKDATGVYARYEIPVREAWKALVESLVRTLTKAKSAGAHSEAIGTVRWLGSAEATYFAQKGRFGTVDELRAADVLPDDFAPAAGYTLDVTVSADGKAFVASAVPVSYGNPARDSYFIDESYVIRHADRQGAAATASDPPVQ